MAFSVGGLADPITIDPRAITNPHRFITGDGDIEHSLSSSPGGRNKFSEQNLVLQPLKSAKHITGKEHQIAEHEYREAGVEVRDCQRNVVNERSENCQQEGNKQCQLRGRREWPIYQPT
jgi:hypothetical protein